VVAKQPKYTPIGEVLSTESAYVQASNILDLVGPLAVESKDTELLTKVAAMYIELGSRLTIPGEDPDAEEEEEEHDLSSVGLGFVPHVHTEPVKEVAEENGRTNRSPKGKQAQGGRIIRIHTKHGEL
jgi:hypothetical protein